MGAWGLGLQANDTALDAIGHEATLARMANTGHIPEYIRDIENWGEDWAAGVLGVGEWLLDAGFSVESIRLVLERAVEFEMQRIDDYDDPLGRRRVLELFRDRLAGKSVSQEEIDASNEGLLSKIADMLLGDEGN